MSRRSASHHRLHPFLLDEQRAESIERVVRTVRSARPLFFVFICQVSNIQNSYFIFQASLIPCVCLRNDPTSPVAADWKAQIHSTLEVIQNMRAINPGSQDCYDVLMQLCGPFLDGESSNPADLAALYPTEESPATQISNVYSMFWPNVDVHEANMMDVGIWGNFMGEDLQMDPIQNAENLQ